MDLNNSASSTDTDVLLKIPHNFFEPNLKENANKSHFSNDGSFIHEIDKFLVANKQNDVHNSTANEFISYTRFADTLQQSQNNPEEQDLNIQMISIFQKKIIQCQQKISILTKSNIEKDEIIRRLKSNEGLDIENANLKHKIKMLEQEMQETVSVINKFQTKNEMLELKIENLTSTCKEMSDISKKQIHELQTRLSNSSKLESDLHKEVVELKSKCREEKENFIKEKNERSHLEREINNLKSLLKQTKEDKVKLIERNEQDKQNIDIKQKKIFNNMMAEFTEKERKLVKEMDVQRAAIKNYYQAQLESALEEKIKEFQEQLEKFQYEIRSDAEEREKASNERVMNQIEMIIQKNEEEIDLIKLKCSEEVDLYRIQLINATKTIESLEAKLEEYQTRRQNIADNLHSIMESQWKKILDVLTCPSRPPSRRDESNDVSESDNNKQQQYHYEPMMNNLSRSEENLKTELLRNYIDKVPIRMSLEASLDINSFFKP
jgi:chromosome segregation ATPase